MRPSGRKTPDSSAAPSVAAMALAIGQRVLASALPRRGQQVQQLLASALPRRGQQVQQVQQVLAIGQQVLASGQQGPSVLARRGQQVLESALPRRGQQVLESELLARGLSIYDAGRCR